MITTLTYVTDFNITTRIFENEDDAIRAMTEEYKNELAKASDPDISFIKENSAMVLDIKTVHRWHITKIPDTTFNRTSECMGEIKLETGKLVVDKALDPDYPGVDIEFIPNNESDDDPLTRPRVLIEQPKGEKLRVLVWADPKSEDYSDNIEFDITETVNLTDAQPETPEYRIEPVEQFTETNGNSALENYISDDGTYLIPMSWSVYSTIVVYADNLQDAVNKTKKLEWVLPTSTFGEYIDDSYHIDADTDEDYINAQSYRRISDDVVIEKDNTVTKDGRVIYDPNKSN